MSPTPPPIPQFAHRQPPTDVPRQRLMLLAWATGLLSVMLVASLSYIFLYGDMLTASIARQHKMQRAYEDRLTALRAQVDIVTSRQLLDQQAVETRVQELLARQDSIGERQRHVQAAIERAAKMRALNPSATRRRGKLEKEAGLATGTGPSAISLRGSGGLTIEPTDKVITASVSPSVRSPKILFNRVESSLGQSEETQLVLLDEAREQVSATNSKLIEILRNNGVKVSGTGETGVGGPLESMQSGDSFLRAIDAIDEQLLQLESLRTVASHIPHGSPVANVSVSSRFGARRDPFTRQRAMHSGIDYSAVTGTPVMTTASGVVVKAGRKGGYGNLVEIDHGNGLRTRYAHLSRILVKPGQRLKRGAMVGKVGSTGRSTGPHLHYEVRYGKEARDPLRYVKLAKKLEPLM